MRTPQDHEPSDDALVGAAREGRVRAFEELITRHETRVFRVLRLMGVPAQDREDVAQEVFVRVFRHLNGFRRGRPFRSWVYGITVNAAHDYRSRRARTGGESACPDLPEAPDRGAGPAEAAEDRELRRRLLRALGRLSDRERAVFVLLELEGLDTRAAARTLGITAITVRRHLGRARTRLRRILEDQER